MFSDKPLTKLDQSQSQCQLLVKQSIAKCQAVLEAYGGADKPLWTQLPPLPNSASKFPRFVGPQHEERQQLKLVKAKQKNFKQVLQRRSYPNLSTIEKSQRYRGRNDNWVALGKTVGLNTRSILPSGSNRKSTAKRIAESRRRLAERRPHMRERYKGDRPRACPPAQRNN